MKVNEKISALRQMLAANHLDAWIAPSADPHQSEYVPLHWESREWLSGFTGSAGTVVVTKNKAGLWTDSRYFLQAELELKGTDIILFKSGLPEIPTYEKWLSREVAEKSSIGFDATLLSVSQVKALTKACEAKEINFVTDQDLMDEIWSDRPEISTAKVDLHPVKMTGESRGDKLQRIRKKMGEMHVHQLVISTLDDIAWTFNFRGTDIQYCPVVISYAIINQKEAKLFIQTEKVKEDVKQELQTDGLTLFEYLDFYEHLSQFSPTETILFEADKSNQKIIDSIPNHCRTIQTNNIVTPLKAIKNETELKGFRNAHLLDGAAMVKWLYWLEGKRNDGFQTESSLAEKLNEIRLNSPECLDLSFPPIIGYQANGAIIHYSPKPETAALIKNEGILLVDSGGQYPFGTTDITRTIALGTPTKEQIKWNTLVLKGHINLATLVFPENTPGSQLDAVARVPLWKEKLNFGHGTGHGVGHFLNVHEGPQSISPKGKVGLKPGMIVSNEPGLYIDGSVGFRIENLVVVIALEKNDFGTFCGLETLTLCPYDLSLVDASLLNKEEINWLNKYHRVVFEKLAFLLNPDERNWLKEKTIRGRCVI